MVSETLGSELARQRRGASAGFFLQSPSRQRLVEARVKIYYEDRVIEGEIMIKRILMTTILLTICSVTAGLKSQVFALEMDLVGLLTKNLGVTDQQAEGGAGAIFNSAAQQMSAEDFAKVSGAMPEVGSLIAAAPAADAGSGTLGGLSSMLSKGGGGMASLADLAGSFSKLGLSGDMVGKFIPIVLEYAQAQGGDEIAGLLKMALQ